MLWLLGDADGAGVALDLLGARGGPWRARRRAGSRRRATRGRRMASSAVTVLPRWRSLDSAATSATAPRASRRPLRGRALITPTGLPPSSSRSSTLRSSRQDCGCVQLIFRRDVAPARARRTRGIELQAPDGGDRLDSGDGPVGRIDDGVVEVRPAVDLVDAAEGRAQAVVVRAAEELVAARRRRRSGRCRSRRAAPSSPCSARGSHRDRRSRRGSRYRRRRRSRGT